MGYKCFPLSLLAWLDGRTRSRSRNLLPHQRTTTAVGSAAGTLVHFAARATQSRRGQALYCRVQRGPPTVFQAEPPARRRCCLSLAAPRAHYLPQRRQPQRRRPNVSIKPPRLFLPRRSLLLLRTALRRRDTQRGPLSCGLRSRQHAAAAAVGQRRTSGWPLPTAAATR